MRTCDVLVWLLEPAQPAFVSAGSRSRGLSQSRLRVGDSLPLTWPCVPGVSLSRMDVEWCRPTYITVWHGGGLLYFFSKSTWTIRLLFPFFSCTTTLDIFFSITHGPVQYCCSFGLRPGFFSGRKNNTSSPTPHSRGTLVPS